MGSRGPAGPYPQLPLLWRPVPHVPTAAEAPRPVHVTSALQRSEPPSGTAPR
ncbi:unnamed protein product [Gulo gulo]|uniref:Uncharacterized protein n=1 Tax=Gulo gulo TaxID=48420 RepID=A0A9X9LNP0_GULGU|nr:unnamed protein product [Gulo gulo]